MVVPWKPINHGQNHQVPDKDYYVDPKTKRVRGALKNRDPAPIGESMEVEVLRLFSIYFRNFQPPIFKPYSILVVDGVNRRRNLWLRGRCPRELQARVVSWFGCNENQHFREEYAFYIILISWIPIFIPFINFAFLHHVAEEIIRTMIPLRS